MDNSIKLQMDVKNNAQELQRYMLDLCNWEEEMKKKEIALNNEKPQQSVIPPPRNKIKRTKSDVDKSNSDKPKKISAYDYSAWDKFDVEKACAEVDEERNDEVNNEDEEISSSNNEGAQPVLSKDNKNFSLIDEAFYEKELGNQLVKKEKWADAIKCYTNAINLDSKNAIYYANRSLCFLKLKNFKSAETDATTAIQLDENYIKAFQRRGHARLALGQLTEAKADFEKILTLEPNNRLAKAEISKINEKLDKDKQEIMKSLKKKTFDHKNIFKSEESKPKISTKPNNEQNATSKSIHSVKNEVLHLEKDTKNCDTNKRKEIDTTNAGGDKNIASENKSEGKSQNKSENKCSERGDGDKKSGVQSAQALPKIFKPLPEWCKVVQPIHVPPHKRSKKHLRRIEIATTEKNEDTDIVGCARTVTVDVCERTKETEHLPKPDINEFTNTKLLLEVPKTAIQFQNCWKIIRRNPKECYKYLKKIPGKELAHIFGNSLESDFFSELITFLAKDDSSNDLEVVYDILFGLTKVKRFSSIILFMSQTDRACVKKCISELDKSKSEAQLSELLKLYELEF